METFYVTFGQRYRRDVHPTLATATPDGWLEVDATTLVQAEQVVMSMLSRYWSQLYDSSDWHPEHFPAGAIARISRRCSAVYYPDSAHRPHWCVLPDDHDENHEFYTAPRRDAE